MTQTAKVKNVENIEIKDKIPEKEVEASAPSKEEDQKPIQVMSDGDSLISNLVKEAPAELPSATVVGGKAPNLLALPDECKKLHGKQFRFRWMANDKRLRSKLQSGIWVLCTKLNCSFIKKERFKSHGAVEQSGMLLAFCTEKVAQMREQAPAKKSADLVKHYTEDIHHQEGFYKPAEAGADDDDGLIEGRDF